VARAQRGESRARVAACANRRVCCRAEARLMEGARASRVRASVKLCGTRSCRPDAADGPAGVDVAT
jgi:hypothetical protein